MSRAFLVPKIDGQTLLIPSKDGLAGPTQVKNVTAAKYAQEMVDSGDPFSCTDAGDFMLVEIATAKDLPFMLQPDVQEIKRAQALDVSDKSKVVAFTAGKLAVRDVATGDALIEEVRTAALVKQTLKAYKDPSVRAELAGRIAEQIAIEDAAK
jgi:hypothetical protein